MEELNLSIITKNNQLENAAWEPSQLELNC